ncbi:response regulator [Verrucomicrobiota bacterium sgz303538]
MESPESNQPIEILLVEDSETDSLLIREALCRSNIPHHLHWVEDGVEAIAFLRREGKYTGAPRPHLILLDLNLPRKNGREVLAEIKADDHLKTIPIVVLTASRAEEDILKVYGLYANCYVTKPLEFSSFATVVQSIEQFWFRVVTLPP